MMRRFATLAALGGTVILAGSVTAGVAGFGLPGVKNAKPAPIVDRRAPPLNVDAKLVDASQSIGIGNADIFDVEPTAAAMTGDEAEVVHATLRAPSQMPSPEMTSLEIATATTPDPVRTDDKEAISTIETPDECLVPDFCIDQYLWSVYQRTPKLDTIKVVEHRKVIVMKKGKPRTVVRQFTKLVDEDFTWKDPRAAEKAGMSLMEYVIGGMDRSFKLKLYNALRALDHAGLSPGITSAFRDDYRQSLASGLKAATDRSYHGGSFRGGYGHGLAADLVSVKGDTRAQRLASSEDLWKWIDAHGKEFGIGRPYLDKDPPHVAPIDGKEYADHRRGANTQRTL